MRYVLYCFDSFESFIKKLLNYGLLTQYSFSSAFVRFIFTFLLFHGNTCVFSSAFL